MIQSRLASMTETLALVLTGSLPAVGLQLLLFPAFGLHNALGQSLKLALWFTALSVLRRCELQRLFMRLRTKSL